MDAVSSPHGCKPDPIIFRGLKSISLNDTQQQSLLRLAQEGISVYSPHTAVDVVPDGMADWLCDIVSGAITALSSSTSLLGLESQSHLSIVYPRLGKDRKVDSSASSILRHTKTTIHPSPSPIPEGFENAGAGRLVTFAEREPLVALLHRIKNATGNPASISVAIPQSQDLNSITISTVGVCPGSGAGVLMKPGPSGRLPDLLLTGELSHHDALAAIEQGSVVVTLFHSNTERGYLRDVMQRKLTAGLHQLWKETSMQKGVEGEKATDEQWGDFKVDVSQRDRDPYGIVIL
jgi:putative NIF3 family GTP cyclohydrolase 1 type 2